MIADSATSGTLPRRGPSSLWIGVGTLLVLLLYFWFSGALFVEQDAGFWMTSAQTTGMLLTYATTPAFLFGVQGFIARRTAAHLDQLVREGVVAADAFDLSQIIDPPIGLASRALSTGIGFVLGALNVPWPLIFSSIGRPWMFTSISIAFGNLFVWIVVVRVLHRRLIASNAIRKLGRDHAEVDLLRLGTVLPFGRIGLFDLLVVAVAISLAAFQSLDAELRWANYGAALAAGIPAGLLLLSLPMLGVRERIRREKARELEAIDEAVRHADRELQPEALHYLGDLLRRRELVAQVGEWPLDTTGLSRIAFYVVIPPIAWVGAALVEIGVQSAL